MAIFGKNKKSSFAKAPEDKEDEKKEEKKASVSSSPKKEVKKETMKDLYGGVKESKGTSSKSKNVKEAKTKYNSAYKNLIKPLITEKAANLATENKYVFEVSVDSNKIEVAKSVEEVYGVKTINVNILNMEGKRKKQGRIIGKRKDWKKAIVTLKKGQTIDIYEGV